MSLHWQSWYKNIFHATIIYLLMLLSEVASIKISFYYNTALFLIPAWLVYMYNMVLFLNGTLCFLFCFTIPPGTYKKVKACRAESHYLHKLNDLNAKKSQPGGESNMQSRHVPREPHTNWDGIFLCHSTILKHR